MTAITYRESLAGFVDFGADDWNEGWIAGARRSAAAARSTSPSRSTTSTRSSRTPSTSRRARDGCSCDGLGGRLAIERGLVQPAHRRRRPAPPPHGLPAARARRRRAAGHVRRLQGRPRRRLPRPVGGHVDAVQPPLRRPPRGRARTRPTRRLATGILRIDRVGFGKLLGSIRAHGAGPLGRLAAKARWGALFTAGLIRVYAGPAEDGQPDFPSPRAGHRAVPGLPGRRVARGARAAGARAADPAGARAGRAAADAAPRAASGRRTRSPSAARCCSGTGPACGRTSSTRPRCARRSSTRCSTPGTTSGSRAGAGRSTSTPASTRSTRSPCTTTRRSSRRCSRRPGPRRCRRSSTARARRA